MQCVIVKTLKFIKEQGAKGSLANLLAAKIPILSNNPLVNTLF